MDATASCEPSPQLKLRWFQYSLRSLLLFMLVCSLACSWFAVELQKARRQHEAAAEIVRSGGAVWYDYQFDPAGKKVQGAARPAPTWLRMLYEEDLFDQVVEIAIMTDAQLEQVRHFPHLRSLRFGCSSHLTDAGLAHLQEVPQLRWLHFGAAPNVTDAGLVNLRALKQLQKLEMRYLNITDAGMQHLEGLTELEELTLGWAKITDAGLVHLRGLGRLHTLSLGESEITDAGMEHLKGLTQLTKLRFNGTKVTREGLHALQQALPNCRITDSNARI